MPCGGVHPCKIEPDIHCFWCRKNGCGHFYEEFDAYCHARCFLLDLYLNPGGEAGIALKHEHQMYLDTTADELHG